MAIESFRGSSAVRALAERVGDTADCGARNQIEHYYEDPPPLRSYGAVGPSPLRFGAASEDEDDKFREACHDSGRY